MAKETRSPVLVAYDAVIARVKAIHLEKFGTERGALAWLGTQLKTSKQTVENWSRRTGIPQERVAKIAKITGMEPSEIRPKTVNLEAAAEDWREFRDKNPDLAARFVEYPSKRRAYGTR